MAKANVTLPGGAMVTIDGTAAEVAAVLQVISGPVPTETLASSTRRRRSKSAAELSATPTNARTTPRGPAVYIRELVKADYFKTRRGLGDVKQKLEEGAHIYPVTHLSPVLFRLVRTKELRRIKEGGAWKYVNP
jgi:hypothetical protein